VCYATILCKNLSYDKKVMKPAIYILTSIVMLAAACGKSSSITASSTLSLDMEADVRLGECLASTGGEVRICYDKLLEDSRCPKGAVCVWAGNTARCQICQGEGLE
jgi:hypothetical protein